MVAGKAPLARSPALDAYAEDCAERDTMARLPHVCFNETRDGGPGVAETETLLFSESGWGSIVAIIREGLAQIAVEGTPGFTTLSGPYTELGCGVFKAGDEVTVVQSYR